MKDKIKIINAILKLGMNEQRMEKLEPTCREWMGRADRLDEAISSQGLGTPPAANIFKH